MSDSQVDSIELFDFSRAEDVDAWKPLDDVVMGGCSSSWVKQVDGVLRHEGEVSLEQGGGFASIQADITADLSGMSGIGMCVRSDGKRYKFGLYDRRGRRRIAYRARFQGEEDSWTEVLTDFDDLEPRFRGRDMPDADPLDTSHLRGMSILIADRQDGPFRIELASIWAFSH